MACLFVNLLAGYPFHLRRVTFVKNIVLKQLYLFSFLFLAAWQGRAQAPANYYNSAEGLNGADLRSALHHIIKGHTSLGYSALWLAYETTDKRPDNGKVWDIYSDKPGGTAPYFFTFGSDQCGNYNSENDCYNREHSWPQSYFNDAEPMRSDLFHVYPTDGYVNNKRSNFAYGEVGSATWTSLNGSKLGANIYPGYSGTVFEPVDSFKGDIARTYFYMATRYYTEDGSWNNWAMANKAELKPWAVNMLLEWHHNDPVSQKEINRNNAVYAKQHNRNPFIDRPEFADCIWGTGDCTAPVRVAVLQKIPVRVYPNPATTTLNIDLQGMDAADGVNIEIKSLQGQSMYAMQQKGGQLFSIPLSGWSKGFYLVAISSAQGRYVQKLVVE